MPAASPAETPVTIRFGYPPTENPIAQKRRLMPLLEVLGAELGVTFELDIPFSLDRMVRNLRDRLYDLATVGPDLCVRVLDRGTDYRPLVIPLRRGRREYRAVLMTRPETGITRLEDLAGRTLACVNRNSTAGYRMPRHMLGAHHLLDRVSIHFVGSYENVMKSVRDGRHDAGAVFEGAWEEEATRKGLPRDALRPFAISEPMPNEATLVSARFELAHPDIAARLVDAFKNLNQTDAGREALSRLGNGFQAFEPVSADVYLQLRDRLADDAA